MKKDLISGGLGDNRPDSDFDSEQLRIGIEIEMEHTNDKEKAKEIAKDHLIEDPQYYQKLREMEEKLLKEIESVGKEHPEWQYKDVVKTAKDLLMHQILKNR